MLLNIIRVIAAAAFASAFALGSISPALGQASGEYEVFNDHDPESTTAHVYQDLDQFLRATVFDVGLSHRFRVSIGSAQLTGRRLGGGSRRTASWLEGNRIRYHLFGDGTLRFLEDMKADMVAAVETDDIATWNRNEQLAYWLNLHNLLVLQATAEKYPYNSAKKLHKKSWGEDVVTIKGVDLSILEIQNEIILSIWDDPMVIYGLFQGAIGGPSLRPLALRGTTIGLSLQKNGEEFVNSNRGVNSRGKKAQVSSFYRWTAKAFPNYEADLKKHLLSLSDGTTAAILNKKRGIRSDYFNWKVPDFFGGRMSSGGSSSTSAATAIVGASGGSAGTDSIGVFFQNATLGELPADSLYYGRSMPAHALDFLSALKSKFKRYSMANRGMTNGEMLNGEPLTAAR